MIRPDGRPVCRCMDRYSEHEPGGGKCGFPACACPGWAPHPPPRWSDLHNVVRYIHMEWHAVTGDGATVGRHCLIEGCPSSGVRP